jgi:hypothetical protein
VSGDANVITAYAAAANGSLTPVPGSPFADNVLSMAVNGKYLFGANRVGVYVAAFLIQSNGALKWTTSTDVARYNPSGCVVPGDLIFDHTGADLYFAGTAGSECDSSLYQSFKVQTSDGYLQFLGNTPVSFLFNTPLSFSGNNVYAYGSDCINFQGNWLDTFTTYKRESNGLLTATSIDAPLPSPPNSGDIYCRTLAAADPTNHFAMVLQPIDTSTSRQDGPSQLATYTISSSGALSTASTYQNMPSTAIEPVAVLSMAPSGKLLAQAASTASRSSPSTALPQCSPTNSYFPASTSSTPTGTMPTTYTPSAKMGTVSTSSPSPRPRPARPPVRPTTSSGR